MAIRRFQSLLVAFLLASAPARAAITWVDAGGAYGVEPRNDGVVTLYVAGPDHALDSDSFTAQSWLTRLPRAAQRADIDIAPDGDCLAVREASVLLFRLCSPDIGASGDKSVLLETAATHIVGLGQEFQAAGDTIAERAGWIRHGLNARTAFNGGANGNILFPIAYFDLPGHPFALILDNRYAQEWDLTTAPYRLRVAGGDLRLQVITGASLADIRRRYMEMAGKPPVPPKQMFGLWISEYGYDNWAELDGKIASLKQNGFPLSGVILDLFWFGGVEPGSRESRMGSLTWDRDRFPDPEAKIKSYAAEGIGTMLIEESYVSEALPEHAALEEVHGLAHDSAGSPVLTNPDGNWWGKGGMIDWTNTEAAAFWHDFRRQPLIDMGVIGHWTDLGEPAMVNPDFLYGTDNRPDASIRNSYNLLWTQSIFDGYRRSARDKRPFILSRSGGMGIQQYGAALWSADTSGDFGSLAAQMAQQQHMMWSGLDYYGSDIGGFHRGGLGNYPGSREELTNELYTQWFAYSALFEVPVRPHTDNRCNCRETAPDRIGDLASNRANIELRYDLLPYYYSLAHHAWLDGEPVFPSLDYYFDDPKVRGLGHQKMIGSELVAAAIATPGANEVPLYLPEGNWYDLRSSAMVPSAGETFTIPIYRGTLLELPVYARDGAIVPMTDGVLRVFGDAPNLFEWFDDDGITTGYQRMGYSQLHIAVGGEKVSLSRGRGDIAVKQLVWTLPEPVTTVFIDGEVVPFRQEGSTVTVTIPPFEQQLIVTVKRG